MENKSELLELVSSILPTDEKVEQAINDEDAFQECMDKLVALMFKEDVTEALAKIDAGQRGVCGTVWGRMEKAYKCNTCGLDEYCSICVTCFRNGNHTGHDYRVIDTKGGSCDCGDVTAWRPEGFCSNHGSEHIQPLEDNLVNSMGPVIDALFEFWKNKLSYHNSEESKKYANGLTRAIVEMLLNFSELSQSLLSFIAVKVKSSPDLLKFLVMSEMFLRIDVVKELHELLLILIGEYSFRYEFAKQFLTYYPIVVNEIIQEGADVPFKEDWYPMLRKFGNQFFSVPTITCCLLKENLLEVLFACLKEIFVASAGDDGRLEAVQWIDFQEITTQVVENIRLVTSHAPVLQYMIHEQRDLSWTWLQLVSFVQGVYPFKRVAGIDPDEINIGQEVASLVGQYIADIHRRLVHSAFDVSLQDNDSLRVLQLITWMTHECLRGIENWHERTCGRIIGSTVVDSSFGILGSTVWPNIIYDVSSQEVSIHLPLHHLLSLLLQNVLTSSVVPDMDVFRHLLRGCHPYGYSALIMEHPLRIRVFCAQYRANMWSMHSETALLSFDRYSNVRSSEGLESDLFLLQFCAAFAPADSYVERILGCFGLSDCCSLKRQNSSEYEPALVKEMLTLIIQILQERRYCGLAPSECLKRDLIYKLAIEDSTYSMLMGSLLPELSQHDHLKEILDTIAIYPNPFDENQGKYSLRPTFWKEVDWYHPRLYSSDLQAAEERYKRFGSVSSLCTQQLPRWTYICPPLQGVARIATCRPVLQIIRAILYNAKNSRSSDQILITALHLLSLALDICLQESESGNRSSCMLILAFSDEEIGDEDDTGNNLLSLLVILTRMHKENVDGSSHINISSLMEILVKKFAEIIDSAKLQHLAPEIVSQSDVGIASNRDKGKAKAKERQASIMEKMKAEQSKFLSSIDSAEFDDLKSGPGASSGSASGFDSKEVLCSLCHESNPTVSFIIFLQKSRFLSFTQARPSTTMETSSSGSSTRNIEIIEDRSNINSFETFENDIYDSSWKELNTKMFENENLVAEETSQDDASHCNYVTDVPGFGRKDWEGIHLSSCGHAIHQRCLDEYLLKLKETELGIERGHMQIADSDQVEFLCPLCRALANCLMPALPEDFHKAGKQSVSKSEESNSLRLPQAIFLLQSIATRVRNIDIVRASSSLQRNTEIIPNLQSVSRVVSLMYFLENSSPSPSLILWDTLKYNVMSVEVASRCGRNFTSPSLSLDALYREVESPTGFVLSLMVKLVKKLESMNSILVLQRFRGLQALSKSICSGVSMDFLSETGGVGGEIDMQFWNRGSDPVLIHDPFSSLMWLIFFLPSPFMTCEETFIFLLHIFYAVSVAQALIIFCVKREFKMGDCEYPLINEMCKIMGKSGFAKKFFVSDYVDQSSELFDVIRKLSFPYLRRCGLLLKLLTTSIPVPYGDNDDHKLRRLSLDTIESDVAELEGVQELETIFKIPSIDMILKNEVLRSLILKWVHHFEKASKARSFQCAFYYTPAVPFKLMQLPHLYEDLLQRYMNGFCPACKRDITEPALCLLCGRLCSANEMACCGESNFFRDHAMSCGAGIGVFLLIRSTRILLQRCAFVDFWPSPYVDRFGEEDVEMLRGRPLFLNEDRYAAIAYMVASHGLHRSSKFLGQPIAGAFFNV